MNRIPYLEPLVNWLKASPTLNNHGIAGVPDLAGKNIYVYSEWSEHKDSRNYGPLLLIQPTSADNLDQNRPDCLNEFSSEFFVMCQVKNARKTQQHFQEDISTGVTTYEGGYPDAANLEDLVRQTILEFNVQVLPNAGYSPVELKGLETAYSEDGLVVLKQIYTTKIMF